MFFLIYSLLLSQGVTNSNRKGTGWTQITRNFLVSISVGGGFAGGSILELPIVYGVGSSGTVYRRDGITQDNRSGSDWTALTVQPPMQQVRSTEAL